MRAHRPELLMSLSRPVSAANQLLEGCAQEYLNAVVTGRLDVRAKMAHSIIDLLAISPLDDVSGDQ